MRFSLVSWIVCSFRVSRSGSLNRSKNEVEIVSLLLCLLLNGCENSDTLQTVTSDPLTF